MVDGRETRVGVDVMDAVAVVVVGMRMDCTSVLISGGVSLLTPTSAGRGGAVVVLIVGFLVTIGITLVVGVAVLSAPATVRAVADWRARGGYVSVDLLSPR